MAQQLINIGASPNDGTGTPLRTSFDYTNQNFTELYAGGGVGTSTNTQVIFNDSGVMKGDAGLVYNKTTDALTVTGPLSTGGTLAVTGVTTLTGAATVQGLTVGKGTGAAASNTAFGVNVLAARTTGIAHTGVGVNALAAVTTADSCTAVGNGALLSLTTGTGNVAVGGQCLNSLLVGATNTAIGTNCLINATGSDNVSSGYRSLTSLAAGNHNTAYGTNAGDGQISGSNNGFFGFGALHDVNTDSDKYHYGNGSVATHKFRAGDVVLGTGNVVVASAKGIDFSATANSSGTMTSELLNDYEEGTWVPTDASGAGIAFTLLECKYTKIGRAVTIQGSIQYAANVNGNAAKITGLPFAYVGMAPFSIAYTSASLTGGVTTVAYLIGHFFDGPLFYNSIGTQTLNSSLSGGTIWFFGTYMI